MPLLRERRVIAEERLVEDQIVADGGRRGVPFLREGRVVGRRGHVSRNAGTLPLRPFYETDQHARPHEHVEGHEREHIPQELDLE